MKRYRVYKGDTDEIVAEGTAVECGEKLGMKVQTFYAAASGSRDGIYKRFRVEVVPDEPEKPTDQLQAIEAWDAFCEPIRKRYGIPVRHLGEGKK